MIRITTTREAIKVKTKTTKTWRASRRVTRRSSGSLLVTKSETPAAEIDRERLQSSRASVDFCLRATAVEGALE
jgi:hypothetical protein